MVICQDYTYDILAVKDGAISPLNGILDPNH